ncbi:MAG: hypothetical protein JWM14_1703 [Chitinophagaceae bacterium]|nr:hypothetical protein [Chitinophagaceae bacterium]
MDSIGTKKDRYFYRPFIYQQQFITLYRWISLDG